MEDMMKNFSQMMQSGQIPDNIKEMLNSFASNSQTSTNNSNNNENSNNSSFDFSNIDMNTLLKIQQIMSAMNSSQNSSGANLLRSLKPYLKPSRQAKVDEYIGLLSIGNIMKLMNNSGGDNNDS